MNIDFKVYEYDYEKRSGNLKSEAKGSVKSTKYFPYFIKDDKKIIFKPLSKTKPLSTPYFAYSELVWSNLLNCFFDKSIPIYRLAKCHDYDKYEPKYHNYGTIVESITKPREELVNLYEYFLKYPDKHVDISNYINYCMMLYDYSFFFDTKFFKENDNISKEVARQILYSILRADQNYHYENVSLIYDGEYRMVASPIDHEFSSMFIYLDEPIPHDLLIFRYMQSLIEDEKSVLIKNIEKIISLYPNIVEEFNSSLVSMIKHLEQNPIILEDHDYIEPFTSDDFQVGIWRYKEDREDKAKELEKSLEKKLILPGEVNDNLNKEILLVSKTLNKLLDRKLNR